MRFATGLSNSNYALNCVQGNAAALARLFPGMSAGTARNVLDNRQRITRETNNTINVPDDLICSE